MNCFNHSDRAAVGICKDCGKHLCSDCATDLGDGLTCKGLHESEFEASSPLDQRAPEDFQSKRINPFARANILSLACILCTIYALGQFTQIDPVGILLGGGVVFSSIMVIVLNRTP